MSTCFNFVLFYSGCVCGVVTLVGVINEALLVVGL